MWRDICSKCTLEVSFNSACHVFWTWFVSFLTAGFIKIMILTAKTISGRSETRNLLYFERQTKLLKILFLLILNIRKIPWTNFPHRQQLCFKVPLMVKLYSKCYLNSTFHIFHNSSQTGLFWKKIKFPGEMLLKFWYSE